MFSKAEELLSRPYRSSSGGLWVPDGPKVVTEDPSVSDDLPLYQAQADGARTEQEVVELVEGLLVHRESFRNIKSLGLLLLVAFIALAVDRSGWFSTPDYFPAISAPPKGISVLAPTIDTKRVSEEIDYLRQFVATRSRALDLLRYGCVVAPSDVTIRSLAMLRNEKATSTAEEFTFRVEGSAVSAQSIRIYAESLKVVFPSSHLDFIQVDPNRPSGNLNFIITTTPVAPRLAGETSAGEPRL